jgi:hypothetical protein
MKTPTASRIAALGYKDFYAFRVSSLIPVRRGSVLTPCRDVGMPRVRKAPTRSSKELQAGSKAEGWRLHFIKYNRVKGARGKGSESEAKEWGAQTRRAFNQWAEENEE